MATRQKFKMSREQRQNRYFSESFRKQKVREIEQKTTTVSEVSKIYEVSRPAVYKWLHKYSIMKREKVKMVIEPESDTRKILQLKERITELEQIIGQKQIMIDFQDKMIELAQEEYRIDIKKKLVQNPALVLGEKGSTSLQVEPGIQSTGNKQTSRS